MEKQTSPAIFTTALMEGIGAALPSRKVPNAYFEQRLATSDQWIRERVGIETRHLLNDEETILDLAVEASLKALSQASIEPLEIDAIVVGTTTNPYIFPSLGTLIQQHIGANKAFAYDIQAACAGFVYALSNGNSLIRSGQAKTVLVVGADAMSRLSDPQDRTTAVIFADGAGAVVLRGATQPQNRGILSSHLYSDGTLGSLLYVAGGPGAKGPRQYIHMQGPEVMRHAIKKLGESILHALEANNFTADDIDWFIPHQANARIIKGVASHFKIPSEKIVMTIDHHGNTSAGSIPLAMAEYVEQGKIKRGDLILIEALGGGLTWGSVIFRW